MRLVVSAVVVWFGSVGLGCATGDRVDDGGGGGSPGDGARLEIRPETVVLAAAYGERPEQAFSVVVVQADGGTDDVTDRVELAHSNGRIGELRDAVFVAAGTVGGATRVSAVYDGMSASADVTVTLELVRVDPSAPPDAPDLFEGAAEDAGRAPVIAYPPDGAMVPPNLGDFEIHWTDAADSDVWEVALRSEYLDLRVYAAGEVTSVGRWLALAREEWALAGDSHRGDAFSIRVRGMRAADPSAAGTSAPIEVGVSTVNVDGGLYYWTTETSDGSPAGIYRHDWTRPGQPAEQYYTTAESDSGRCVGCHALSRDGRKMGITFDGGPGAGSVLDVAARAPTVPVDGTYRWSFSAWSFDGAYLVTELDGRMTLRDGDSGAAVGDVPTGAGYATYPDFSPVGGALVYGKRDPNQVVVQPFDDGTGAWGDPVVLGTGSVHDSYPAFSPDGAWIVYNRPGTGGNELWVIAADNASPPLVLARAEAGGNLHNSWPRWAPFAQTIGEGEHAETMFWLTFSSDRDFGVRVVGERRPQLWMTPFFPERAARGEDPSAAAFRLPFQNLSGHNHIAQWTTMVVPVD